MLESIIDIVRRAGELVRSASDVTAATHEKNGPADLVLHPASASGEVVLSLRGMRKASDT